MQLLKYGGWGLVILSKKQKNEVLFEKLILIHEHSNHQASIGFSVLAVSEKHVAKESRE